MTLLQPTAVTEFFDGWVHGTSGLRIALDPPVAFRYDRRVEARGEVLTHARVSAGVIELTFLDGEAHIDTLRLWESHQGLGFARALVSHMGLVLPPAGVDDVRLMALGEGGYAWAGIGFDVDERYGNATHLLQQLVLQREATLVQLEANAPRGLELASGLRRSAGLAPGHAEVSLTSIAQIAAIGRDQKWQYGHRVTWFGRELLVGAQWLGHKRLR